MTIRRMGHKMYVWVGKYTLLLSLYGRWAFTLHDRRRIIASMFVW